jgi:two-component system chemotaxis response regulator CheB
MKYYPLPVVVVSSLTQRNSLAALRALELGAVEVIAKPGTSETPAQMIQELIAAIRVAATVNVAKIHPIDNGRAPSTVAVARNLQADDRVIAIGASTGGTQALETILGKMPLGMPGMVVVQHMPATFTAAFAERLDSICNATVREARDGYPVCRDWVLVAPGGKHMMVERQPAGYIVRIRDGPMVRYQRPSVDVLFQSVARHCGSRAMGVLLTGMGADGADGLLAMRENGAFTIAQDEASSIVFGMPAEAIKRGAAASIEPLENIATVIVENLEQLGAKETSEQHGRGIRNGVSEPAQHGNNSKRGESRDGGD